ncbi:hypothetical protein Tco_0509090 [Tanacetum coccineum]
MDYQNLILRLIIMSQDSEDELTTPNVGILGKKLDDLSLPRSLNLHTPDSGGIGFTSGQRSGGERVALIITIIDK